MRPRQRFTTLLFFLLSSSVFAKTFGQNIGTPKEASRDETSFKLPLSQRVNGVTGYLELRQDARLTAKLDEVMWGTGGVNIEDDPELATFKTTPPGNAVIEIIDRAGKVLEAKTLERPLAELRTVNLYGDSRPTYLLTVDYSAGFGSYSGPITSLVEVKDGHLQWIESTEAMTGKTEEISLMESLKTIWEIVDAPDRKGKQILLAQCRPDWTFKEDPNFTVTYARFHFDGAKWLVTKRIVKGYMDFEEGFPNLSSFP